MENHRKQNAAGFWGRKHRGEVALWRRTSYRWKPGATQDAAGLQAGGAGTAATLETSPCLWAGLTAHFRHLKTRHSVFFLSLFFFHISGLNNLGPFMQMYVRRLLPNEISLLTRLQIKLNLNDTFSSMN